MPRLASTDVLHGTGGRVAAARQDPDAWAAEHDDLPDVGRERS
jgi:hypothetical protein